MTLPLTQRRHAFRAVISGSKNSAGLRFYQTILLCLLIMFTGAQDVSAQCINIEPLECGIARTFNANFLGSWLNSSCGFSTPGQEKLYSFTPAVTGNYAIKINSTNQEYVHYSYKMTALGCNEAEWTCITVTSDPGNYTIGQLTAGVPYYIKLDAEYTGQSIHNFQMECAVGGIANNECYSATNLTPAAACMPVTGTTVDASQTIEGLICNGVAGIADDDVWYKFVATAPEHIVTLTCDPGFDGVLDVRVGTCPGINIACANSTGSGGSETLTLTNLNFGETYYVRIYSQGGSTGDRGTFSICITNPPFDPCSNITMLNCNTSTTYSTSGQGNWIPDLFPCTNVGNGREKIYSFTPAQFGQHFLNVSSTGQQNINYYIKTASGGCNSTGWSCIGPVQNPTTLSMGSLMAGTQYYLLLDPTNIQQVTHSFKIDCPTTAPSNDECANAISLISGLNCNPTHGTTVGTTQSAPPISCNGFTGSSDDDVWFRFTAVSTIHTITLTEFGNFDAVLDVRSGSCNGTTLTCVDATSGGGAETLLVNGFTVGTTYYIRVYSYNNISEARGYFNICVTHTIPEPCASIENITCNAPTSVSISGPGLWGTPGCFANPSGQEKIYSFTPIVSGLHNLSLSSSNGQIMNYYMKPASGGCSSSGWTCIGNTSFPSMLNMGNLSVGVEYYLMLVPQNISLTTHNFQINCPIPAPTNDDCANAIPLNSNSSCIAISGTTVGASQSLPAVTCSNFTGFADDDVWYKFVAVSSNQIITVVGVGNFDAVIDLRSGSCGNLTYLGCADTYVNGTEALNAYGLTVGETYYFRIYGFAAGPSGTGNFTVCVSHTLVCTITDQAVTANPTTVVAGSSSTITVGATQPGVNYTLRTDPANTFVAGPLASNGPAINFNTGPINSTTTYNVLAEKDKFSINLTGDQAGIIIPENSALDLINNFIIEGWIKPNNAIEFSRMFNKSGSYALGLSNGQSSITFTRHSGGDYSRPYNFVTGVWYHIACTYSSGTVEFFVNGISQGTVSGVEEIVETSFGAQIGSESSNFHEFEGNIDNVRIWNNLRTQSEIAAEQFSYLTSAGNPSLVASWWIIEGSGLAKDYSSNAINASGFIGTWQADSPLAQCNMVLTNKPVVTANQNIVLICPVNTNTTACQTQTAVNSAFATWLATASASGGCNGVLTNNNTGAPSACGGSRTVTFTYTSTCAPTVTTCEATFTVPAPPTVLLNCPSNTTTAACQTQTAVNSAFANWLSTASASGGCNGVLTNNNTGAPSACGGSTTVTFTYTSSCAPTVTTCQATFTVNSAPVVNLTCAPNTTTGVNQSQSSVNAAFTSWLNTTTVSGGCNGILTNNNTGAPSACGGSTTVTFTYTSSCAPLSTTCQATFTVPPADVTVTALPASQTTCSAASIIPIVLTGNVIGSTFDWTRDNSGTVTGIAASGTGDISGTLTNNTTAPVLVTFTVTPSVNGCTGTPITATVLVNPTPDAVASPTSQTICSNSAITNIELTGAVSGTSYSWTRDNTNSVTGIAASGSGNISGTLTNTTLIPVTVNFTITPTANGCAGTPVISSVTVKESPSMNTPANILVCNTSVASVIFTSQQPGTTYTWINDNIDIALAPNGSGDIYFVGLNSSSVPRVANITVTPSYNGCSGLPVTFTITVNPAFSSAGTQTYATCTDNATASVIAYGGTALYSYLWSNGQTTSTASGLSAGAYTVTVTDAVGCAILRNYQILSTTLGMNAVQSQTVCNGAPTQGINFSASALSGIVCANVAENQDAVLTAPPGSIISEINFASYGTPFGSCGNYIIGSCHSASSMAIVSGIALGKNSVTINAANAIFGEPCFATAKRLYIQASYIPDPAIVFNWSNNNTTTGLNSSGTGNIASFTVQNNTNIPNVSNIIVTPSLNGCNGIPQNFNITVNPTPNVVATPTSQTICSGNAITTIVLSGPVNGTTYTWIRDNTAGVTGIAASGTGNISGNLTNNTSDPVLVTFTVTPSANNCSGASITATVLVNPTPNVVATPTSQTICSGNAITTIALSGLVSGTTYSWTRDNTAGVTGIEASGTGNISGSLTNTTSAPVLVTFTVTTSANNCSGASITATVLVNPTPNVIATPTTQTICSGAAITTITLSGAVTGTTYNWTRNNTANVTGIAASGSGNISGVLFNNTANPVTVTFTITPTANGCTGASITTTIIVNPNVTATATPATQTICTGFYITPITLSGLAAGTTFTWTRNNTGTITGIPASGSGNISGTLNNNTGASVTVTFTITPSSNGCNGTPVTATVIVNPGPVGTININPNPVCVGSTVQMNAGGGITYSWSGPQNWTSNQQNPTLTVINHLQAGTYKVTITSAPGCSVVKSAVLSVNYPPVATATYEQSTACVGSTLILHANGGGSYLWTGPNGFISKLKDPSILNTTTANSGMYTLTVTSPNGCTATVTLNITINPAPVVTANPLLTETCEGSTVQLFGTGSGTFLWTGPAGYISHNQNPVIQNIVSQMSGEYKLKVTSPQGSSATASVAVKVYDRIYPVAYATPQVVCEGQSLQLNAEGGSTYLWVGPNGFNSNDQNPVIDNINLKQAGTYYVYVYNEGGCFAYAEVKVEVTPALKASAYASPNPVNELGSVQFFASNGISHLWTGPGGFTSTFQNPIIKKVTRSMAGIYTVAVKNENGCPSIVKVNLRVNYTNKYGERIYSGEDQTDYGQESVATVFPNPTNDVLYLEAKGSGAIEYMIFDMNGNVQSTLKNTSDNYISTKKLSNGVYQIRWKYEDEQDWNLNKFVKIN